MKKALHILDNLEEYLVTVLLPIMCIIIFISTVGRFTTLYSLPWAEEAARYCMIWIIFLGISSAAKKGSHFAVSAITGLLTEKIQKIIAVLRVIIVDAVNIFIAYYSIIIIQNQIMMEQVSPSLKIPMWMMYLAIPIGCILMAIRYSYYTLKQFKSSDKLDDMKERVE